MSSNIWSLQSALANFVQATATQSGAHIAPLHWHLAARLVIEGGFWPDCITPRPPLRAEPFGTGRQRSYRLSYSPELARPGESTVYGGLKTKDVDVVVALPGIGPCLAISVKGTLNAFRNLTNRMEEAAGDCTNIHMAYPALVYGFLHVLRANREAEVENRNDIAVFADGAIADTIQRYHDAMARLTGRLDLRDDVSRYEVVSLAMVDSTGPTQGFVLGQFPAPDSRLRVERFLARLYEIYDLRFVYAAPALCDQTRRYEWVADDSVLHLAAQAAIDVRQAIE
jgi:hypothetical protein